MSLIHWWPLNGTYKDEGIKSIDLIPSGTTFSTNGKIGQSLEIKADGQYAKCTDLATLVSLKQYTLSCWVYIDDRASAHSASLLSSGNWNSSQEQVCFGFYNYNNGSYRTLLVPNKDGWSAGISLKEGIIQPKKWAHVVITYDGAKTKGYINNQYVGFYTGGGFNATDVDYYYLGAATYYSGFTLKGKLNDFRIYDNVLDKIEITKLYQLQLLHYDFNLPIQPYTNIIPENGALEIYNNYSQPATLTKLEETFHHQPIYRLTMTLKDEKASYSFKHYLANQGVDSKRVTLKANKKYVHFIYYRPVTHNNIIVGGAASNIGGWKSYTAKSTINEWYITGQYRDGTVTTDKTDYIFTSFYCPDLEVGDTISIDFSCPTLIEGMDQMIDSYATNNTNIIPDCSGYHHHGLIHPNAFPVWSSESPIGVGSYKFNGTQTLTHPNPFLGQDPKKQEWTVCAWVYLDGDTSTQAQLNNFNLGLRLDTANDNKLLLYLNDGSNDYYIYSSRPLTRQKWVHVAFVFNNNDNHYRKIYENGVDISGYGPNKTSTPQGLSDNIYIGSNLSGKIADYSIYGTALSQKEIQDLYSISTKISKQGKIYTGMINEPNNLFQASAIEQVVKDKKVNQSTKKMIYDGRRAMGISASTFYDNGIYYSILNPGLFKANTSYQFHLVMNSHLMNNENEVPGGLRIHFTDGTEDRTFVVKTGGKWMTFDLITPPNKIIDAIYVYYYTGTLFYIDLDQSFIIEKGSIQVGKNKVLTTAQLIEKITNFRIYKNHIVETKEVKED